MHQLPVFKSPNKNHLTPPLDLSEARRQVERPLDLSVKTRKRCADTTEFGEQIARHGLISEASIAKRMCVTRDYAYPQGHPNFHHESFPEKSLTGDPIGVNKLIPQKQLSAGKYPNVLHKRPSQTSPSALAQQQYSDIQRQHISHQSRQMHLPQIHKQTPAQYGLSVPVQLQMHPIQQKSPTSYVSLPANAKRNPHNMTESVTLKGFFEPTHKVTVSANSAQPPMGNLPQQSSYSRVSAERVSGSRTMTGKSNEITDFEELTHQPSFPNTTMYQRRMPALSSGYGVPTSATSGIDLMQQKQIQRQIQAQKSQRDQLVMLSQMNQQKNLLNSQEQQKIAFLMEMQKQHDGRVPQSQSITQSLYGSRSQQSQYTLARQPAVATASYQDSLKKERGDNSTARCIRVGQPVPLSDIHQEHSHALEQVRAIQNHPEIFAQHGINDVQKYGSRNKDTLHADQQQAMLNAARMTHTVRYQPTHSRYGVNIDTNESSPNQISRSETSNVGMNLHPSVIQRPQGYIPPRIVRGSGISSDSITNRRSADRINEAQPIPRYEFADESKIQQELATRDRTAFSQKHHDMLSGKEVMKIQQRVAEQRGEWGVSGCSVYNRYNARVVPNRDIEQQLPITSKESARGKALESRGHEISKTEQSRPVLSDVGDSINDFVKSPGVQSPKTGQTVGPRCERSGSERHMISINTCPTERSITKGTSGIAKQQSDMEQFSQFLIRELKKTDDDNCINPFANRSLLQEFDRSANSSPIPKTVSGHVHTSKIAEIVTIAKDIGTKVSTIPDTNVAVSDDSSCTLPLQIAIPGHKNNLSSSSSSSIRSTVIASAKSESNTANPPKLMSRKQMILNAFRQEEDLKNTANTVDIDKNEKVPMESAKFAARKSDREPSQHGNPTSPKMPILSPQERNRITPLISPAVCEPPMLEESSTSSSNKDSSKREINSLEEHLHRLISDAVKGSVHKDKESVYETVCRELSSQPQGHKVFLSRQLSQTKNIPVANVAPIVHSKAISDAIERHDRKEACKVEDDSDGEDAKMADIVTRSLFGDHTLLPKDNKSSNIGDIEIQIKQEHENEKSDSNLSLQSLNTEPIYDESSNPNRMSPGLKKLMLYRHRDNSTSTNDSTGQKAYTMSEKSKSWPTTVKTEQVANNDACPKVSTSPKGNGRNVFGAFSEIVAQQSSTKQPQDNGNTGHEPDCRGDDRNDGSRWSGYHHADDGESHDIEMVCLFFFYL